MEQQQLFTGHTPPTRVVSVDPVDLGTLDCSLIARGEDGCDYVIKDDANHPAIPHSEWFCSELGERIGIAAPPHKIMALPDGTTVFGSRWQGGLLSPAGSSPWYEKVRVGEISIDEVSRTLSRIYALDQFVHNRDRHAANVLVHAQYQGHAILAFDYSQAWLCFGFPLEQPPLPMCKTVEVQRELTRIWSTRYVKASIVKETCDAIRSLKSETIADIIGSHPESWLPRSDRESIIAWWGSDAMSQRLNRIVEGVENGDCL